MVIDLERQIEEVHMEYNEDGARQYVVYAVPQILGRYFGLQIQRERDSDEIRIRLELRGRGTLRTRDVGRD